MNPNDKNSLEEKLTKRLVKLQEESSFGLALEIKTQKLENEILASIYIWWRQASTIEGYLEKAWAHTKVKGVHKEIEILSFRRLLYLMYGIALDKDSLSRKNFALLAIHDEYEKNSQLYAKDSVSKLSGFVGSRGGVDGLIKGSRNVQDLQTSQEQSSSNSQPVGTSKTKKTPTFGTKNLPSASGTATPSNEYGSRIVPIRKIDITDEARRRSLLGEAKQYFQHQKIKQSVEIHPPIRTNDDEFGVALFKRNGQAFDLLGSSINAPTLNELLVYAYRKQLDALPEYWRCLIETIKTQSLPQNLLAVYDRLLELSYDKHEDKSRKRVERRLSFYADDNLVVLSPMFITSGVVSIAKPKLPLFDGVAADCFMPTRCRKTIENKLLASHDWNMFSVSGKQSIPRYSGDGLPCNLLRLNNKAYPGDFAFVEFWNFTEDSLETNPQLFFDLKQLPKCRTQFSLSSTDLKAFVYEHVNEWLFSYGDNITRKSNQIFQICILADRINFEFDYVNKVFRNKVSFSVASNSDQSLHYSATFLSKDLALALHGIGDLGLISDVRLYCDNDYMALVFETSVAEHVIVVPTTNEFVRNTSAFTQRLGQLSAPEIHQSMDEPDYEEELLLDTALKESNGVITDATIERLLGESPDDYDEITYGFFDHDAVGEESA
jgi:hypothetical protein